MNGNDSDRDRDGGPPYVILEHLVVFGHELVRVVGMTHDQMEAHVLVTTMANAGLRVWRVDLWGEDDGPTVERVVGAAGAAWLLDHGQDATSAGAAQKLTDAGR